MTVVIFDSHGVAHVLVEGVLDFLVLGAGSSHPCFLSSSRATNISLVASLLNGVSPAESGGKSWELDGGMELLPPDSADASKGL